MMRCFIQNADHIILATGVTDFRKQINGLSAIVSTKYKLNPYDGTYVFIFCNRKRNALKVLRYDQNGFVPATKKLLKNMKFQWPMKILEAREITFQQIEWLLQGLEIEQKQALKPIKIEKENSCY